MWLVGKDTTGKTGRVAISDELKAALVRWYTGRGSEADHRACVSLVSTARENHKWIACDCLGAEHPPPLMSAAYLSFQETYYLRRLTSRPGHEPGCPFHLPQAPPRIRETVKDSLYAIGIPKGLFSAHQKAPEKLAQRPEDIEPDDRSRGVAIPRLGKLLWLLLERAGSNILRELPATGRRAGSISEEMRHLKRAAQGLDIAPGIRLSDHLYTNAIDYEKRRVHARLRAAAETWPPEFAPQAFLLLEASEVTSSEVVTGLGTVEIRNRIQHTGIIRAEVEPPFLVLAVVGEHSRREGYLALRAYVAAGERDHVIAENGSFPPLDDHVRAETIELRFCVFHRATETEREERIPADVACVVNEDGWYSGIDQIRIAYVPGDDLTPETLVDLIENVCFCASDDSEADSWDTQHEHFLRDARELAARVLLGEEEAIAARIRDTLAGILWVIPKDRQVAITVAPGTAIDVQLSACQPAG